MNDTGRRGFLGLVASGLAAAAGVAQAGAAKAATYANAYMRDAVPGSDVKFSGCVVRFSNPDGTPSIHANGAHISAGVQSVYINRHGELQVVQTVSGPAENPIIFAFCQPDETLSTRGIIAGASGGTGSTRFRFYDTKLGRQLDLTNYNDRMRMQGKNSNIWLGWVHTSW